MVVESFTLCLNGQRHFHRMARRELPSSLDLLAWLSQQELQEKFYWKGRDGFEVAAAGSLLMLSEPPRFDSGNDSPARLWGGHAFSMKDDGLWRSFPRCAFFLPKVEIIRQGGKVELICHALDGELTEIQVAPSHFSTCSVDIQKSEHLPAQDDWTMLIEEALRAIEGTAFDKVVMARRSTHTCSSVLNPFQLLSKMQNKSGIHFAIQFAKEAAFIGVTPERLYRREGRAVWTEAVAGTRKRGKTDEEDARLEKELLDNPKERREFNFVKTSIEEALKPYCSRVRCEEVDGVVKTPNVQHLHNPFEAELLPEACDADILAALHPTAAMGGLPKKSALEHLLRFEPFDRGWYASPLGFVSQDLAEFAVGIRSALVKENALHLFAGTGIVAGSVPSKEWEELEHKTSLWRDLCKCKTVS